jgi:hypothetical protein
MRAIHKYKRSKHPEAKRRIAQSYGYQTSIWEFPHVIALLQRAGIQIEYTKAKHKDGEIIDLS